MGRVVRKGHGEQLRFTTRYRGTRPLLLCNGQFQRVPTNATRGLRDSHHSANGEVVDEARGLSFVMGRDKGAFVAFVGDGDVNLFMGSELSNRVTTNRGREGFCSHRGNVRSREQRGCARTFHGLHCHETSRQRAFLSSFWRGSQFLQQLGRFLFFPTCVTRFFHLSRNYGGGHGELIPSLFRCSRALGNVVSISTTSRVVSTGQFRRSGFPVGRWVFN